MRRVLGRVHEALREATKDPEVRALVMGGSVDAAVDRILGSELVGAAKQAVRAELAQAITLAGATWTRMTVVPALGMKVAYSALNAASVDALARLELQFFPPIFAETRAAFKVAVSSGLEQGMNPRDIARGLRQYVGLTEYDARIISTFELQVRANPAAALQRALRDARYDGTLQRAVDGTATLTEGQVAAMRDAYVRRLENWRAETWSRTAANNAVKEANLTAWQNSADALGITRANVEKGWSTTIDGREREEHAAMNDEWVPIDEPFSNGDMIPGEGDWNCRCVMLFRLTEDAR